MSDGPAVYGTDPSSEIALWTRMSSRRKIIAMIKLRIMNTQDFAKWSDFSFKNFVEEMAQSSGKSVDEVKSQIGSGPSEIYPDDLWCVVELDGSDIGFFWVKLNPADKSAFGYDIWLAEHVRGKGLGREVMTAGKQLLQNKGIQRFHICVFNENRVARSLYESLGFYQIAYDESQRQHHLEIVIT